MIILKRLKGRHQSVSEGESKTVCVCVRVYANALLLNKFSNESTSVNLVGLNGINRCQKDPFD